MTAYQVMPRLSDEEYADLEQSIKADGVLVPIIVSPSGEIIDGHHRAEIAEKHGIDCPQVVKHGDPTELRTFAYALNLNRRHLSREQRRELIAQSLRQDPQLADREHARRTGASPSTIGAVRSDLEDDGQLSKLDSRLSGDGRMRPATSTGDREARAAYLADEAARQFASSDADHARRAAEVERELHADRELLASTPTPERRPEPVLSGDRLARYDGEKRSAHLGAACVTLAALTSPLPRQQFIEAWRDFPEGASPAQRDRVGPDHFRAYADALLTLADEWETAGA